MRSESQKRIEFLHKKAVYLFPAKSKIFLAGDKLSVEIDNKKVSDISDYLSAKSNLKKLYPYKIGLPVTEQGSLLLKEYQAVASYIDSHPVLDFLQFEYATGRDLALCTFFKSADSVQAEAFIREIKKELPYLINIFKRPLIHLKETDIVQPVDAVKRVNHNTIRHLSKHSENWKKIEGDEITPAKLLTRVYDDDYGIYENIVFRNLIDGLLSFLRKRIFYLSEILSSFKESIQLDAVHRLNHSEYYLAIGKLYVSFSKMENTSEVLEMLENTRQLYKQIRQYTVRDVYTKNSRVKTEIGTIKRTNILSMHKDYKHVYSLYQKANKRFLDSQKTGDFLTQTEAQKDYGLFCGLLALFAVSNFNMSCNTAGAVFESGAINASFSFKGWTVSVSTEYNPILDFDTVALRISSESSSCSFLLIPTTYYLSRDKNTQYENIIERLYFGGHDYDKYVFLEPFDFYGDSVYSYSIRYPLPEKDLHYAVLPVSVSDHNSFRRLQRLLLEGMTLTEKDRKVCAFCGEELHTEPDGKYICRKCRTAIRDISCPCGKSFTATYFDVKKQKPRNEPEGDFKSGLSDFYRDEKENLFRNITAINKSNFICPHCGCEIN